MLYFLAGKNVLNILDNIQFDLILFETHWICYEICNKIELTNPFIIVCTGQEYFIFTLNHDRIDVM